MYNTVCNVCSHSINYNKSAGDSVGVGLRFAFEILAGDAECERWEDDKNGRHEESRQEHVESRAGLILTRQSEYHQNPHDAEYDRRSDKYTCCYLLHDLKYSSIVAYLARQAKYVSVFWCYAYHSTYALL